MRSSVGGKTRGTLAASKFHKPQEAMMDLTILSPLVILFCCIFAICLNKKAKAFICERIETMSVFQLTLITVVGLPLLHHLVTRLCHTVMNYLWR